MGEKFKENAMELAYGIIFAACDGDPLHVLSIAQAMAGTCQFSMPRSKSATRAMLRKMAEKKIAEEEAIAYLTGANFTYDFENDDWIE